MNHIVVIFKKSLYEIYFLERRQQVVRAHCEFSDADVARFRQAHEQHQRTLERVQELLTHHGLRYRVIYRARQLDYAPYDMVLTVGGDGTFLEAARWITTQTILGINSDPERSAGVFCAATDRDCHQWIHALLDRRQHVRRINRMGVSIDGEDPGFAVLNDVLIAHRCPATVSRYELALGDLSERQRSSGLWVSTAAGSTGAIHSAGGKSMRFGSRRLQYKPRELCCSLCRSYALTGGIFRADESLRVRSLMRRGVLFADGSHTRLKFPFGTVAEFRNSEYPLRMVVGLKHHPDTVGT